jgi:uncharacterized membrane protein YhiD involved in acid resistance
MVADFADQSIRTTVTLSAHQFYSDVHSPYFFASVFVAVSSIIALLEPILISLSSRDCSVQHDLSEGFENPNYNTNPCLNAHLAVLLLYTPQQCSFVRRLVIAAFLGGLIGWERRQADRPAGIRTMGLVSLGSCLFSICSAFAFRDGPENWDGSRISAAIPSGVGFLGASLIFKNGVNQVYGLTSAASLWLSAAIGIACAGELYFPSCFAVAVMIILLRFGPRTLESYQQLATEEIAEEEDIEDITVVVENYGSTRFDERSTITS